MKNKKQILIIIISLFILILLSLFGLYRCPFRYIFGVPCPLCGMTRAFISLLKLDISKAFYYHAFWPVVIILSVLYFYFLFKNIKINKKMVCILDIIGILNLVYYFYRLLFLQEVVHIDFENSILYKILLIFK